MHLSATVSQGVVDSARELLILQENPRVSARLQFVRPIRPARCETQLWSLTDRTDRTAEQTEIGGRLMALTADAAAEGILFCLSKHKRRLLSDQEGEDRRGLTSGLRRAERAGRVSMSCRPTDAATITQPEKENR